MNETPSFFSSRTAWVTALIIILSLGLAIRLYDLTDLPLDFHPTRQMLSALKARGMYYQTLTDAPATSAVLPFSSGNSAPRWSLNSSSASSPSPTNSQANNFGSRASIPPYFGSSARSSFFFSPANLPPPTAPSPPQPSTFSSRMPSPPAAPSNPTRSWSCSLSSSGGQSTSGLLLKQTSRPRRDEGTKG